jgi:serine/threonine protein phosphatase PrpC
LLPYDLLLLCSDGLTDMVSDWQIAETINENIIDLDLAANKLVALANQYGGKDNISVILIQT